MAETDRFGIRSRKPTGAVPWPLILLEGEDKSGKSYAAAEFTADERLGAKYWLDVGEAAGDEYYAIDGADYELIEHDGSWHDILGQVRAVRNQAIDVKVAEGGKPTLLVIDSISGVWQLLKDWTYVRAQKTKLGKRPGDFNPDVPIKPAPHHWNDTHARNRTLMDLLMTFPGVVVLTARGKEAAEFGDDGNPVEGQRVWSVDAAKNLGYQVTGWVRLRREEPPTVIGVRSVFAGIRPGKDKPLVKPDFTLQWLIWEHMRCNPASAFVRDLKVSSEATVMKIDAATEQSTVVDIITDFRAIYGHVPQVDKAAVDRWKLLKNTLEQAAKETESLDIPAGDTDSDADQSSRQEPTQGAPA
ncbi:hypothetical protein ACIBCN_18965 [Nocardia sp. NPDC051052]|uniref:hypothetical protein n=1 Tax=Nocardia sp. NPDC051052 TaxID=3364322 RepID=UPI00379B539C